MLVVFCIGLAELYLAARNEVSPSDDGSDVEQALVCLPVFCLLSTVGGFIAGFVKVLFLFVNVWGHYYYYY